MLMTMMMMMMMLVYNCLVGLQLAVSGLAERIVVQVDDCSMLGSGLVLNACLTLVGSVRARSRLARRENVRVEEEVKEEHKVAEVHERRVFDVVERDGALDRRLVGLRSIGYPVDIAAGDHLHDLRRGDELRDEERHAQSHRLARIVRVHERVDEVVHGHEPASARRVVLVAVPAVDEHGGVMIPVEKDELLLAQHDEHGVDELGQLAHDEHEGPEARHAVGIVAIAHRVDDALIAQRVDELGPDAHRTKYAEQGEYRVPYDEGRAQLVAIARAHRPYAHEREQHIGDGDVHAVHPERVHPLGERVDVFLRLEERLEAEHERVERRCHVRGRLVRVVQRLHVEHGTYGLE